MRRWVTKGGVVVFQSGPRVRVVDGRGRPGWKINAYRESDGQPMGYHGLLWLKNLRPAPANDEQLLATYRAAKTSMRGGGK